MKEQILQLFQQNPNAALFISLAISILIALLGLIPSVFITAANILFFGFWPGTAISFVGECIGALIAFILYRKGFRTSSQKKLHRFPRIQQLVGAKGKQAAILILSLRLLPFIPSGLVTFAAAIGSVPASLFIIFSSIGKIPSLLIEAYSIYQVSRFQWQGKLILLLISGTILYYIIRSIKRKNSKENVKDRP